ncbi:23S rRNA (guanosine(2251)-2'-O)-methyltransferase RlmB [Leptobacterium sp. I13]|uniref:23S rRNA (guanosine(2251)-2'-O)-methyltransferase RlmB n=1 Tax=Leptobacterium meishanense TaxID=3128904 RepID=UPI0030EEED6F
MKLESYAFGIRSVIEVIKAKKPIDKVFVQRELKNSLFNELYELIKKKQISISYVPLQKLNKITSKNHQGVIAIISPIEFYDFEELVISTLESEEVPLFLVLDQLSDVRNFGAIIRTAECTGVNGIIIPKRGSVSVTADTIKTSAGAVFNMPICKVDHIKDAVYYLQASGIKVIAATEKAKQTIYESASFKKPIAIIMGAEGKGISPSLLKITDEAIKLPMKGTIASLNVSVACGVFLYEVLRQRNY